MALTVGSAIDLCADETSGSVVLWCCDGSHRVYNDSGNLNLTHVSILVGVAAGEHMTEGVCNTDREDTVLPESDGWLRSSAVDTGDNGGSCLMT